MQSKIKKGVFLCLFIFLFSLSVNAVSKNDFHSLVNKARLECIGDITPDTVDCDAGPGAEFLELTYQETFNLEDYYKSYFIDGTELSELISDINTKISSNVGTEARRYLAYLEEQKSGYGERCSPNGIECQSSFDCRKSLGGSYLCCSDGECGYNSECVDEFEVRRLKKDTYKCMRGEWHKQDSNAEESCFNDEDCKLDCVGKQRSPYACASGDCVAASTLECDKSCGAKCLSDSECENGYICDNDIGGSCACKKACSEDDDCRTSCSSSVNGMIGVYNCADEGYCVYADMLVCDMSCGAECVLDSDCDEGYKCQRDCKCIKQNSGYQSSCVDSDCDEDYECKEDLYASSITVSSKTHICCRPDECAGDHICVESGTVWQDNAGGYKRCDSGTWVDSGCDNDGVAESGESCDGVDLDGKTCLDFGFSGGELGCNDHCQFITSGCYNSVCDNDGVKEAGETCDCGNGYCNANNLGGKTCSDFGYASGVLSCDDTCEYDFSGCVPSSTCDNDGVAESGESCDGVDLDGKTCLDFGFSGGELGCNDHCQFITSGCTGNLHICPDNEEISQNIPCLCDGLNYNTVSSGIDLYCCDNIVKEGGCSTGNHGEYCLGSNDCDTGLECKPDLYSLTLSDSLCCEPGECAGDHICVDPGEVWQDNTGGYKECKSGEWTAYYCYPKCAEIGAYCVKAGLGSGAHYTEYDGTGNDYQCWSDDPNTLNQCPNNEQIQYNFPCICHGELYDYPNTIGGVYCCDNELSNSPCYDDRCGYAYGEGWWCANLTEWRQECQGLGSYVSYQSGAVCNTDGDTYCVTCREEGVYESPCEDGNCDGNYICKENLDSQTISGVQSPSHICCRSGQCANANECVNEGEQYIQYSDGSNTPRFLNCTDGVWEEIPFCVYEFGNSWFCGNSNDVQTICHGYGQQQEIYHEAGCNSEGDSLCIKCRDLSGYEEDCVENQIFCDEGLECKQFTESSAFGSICCHSDECALTDGCVKSGYTIYQNSREQKRCVNGRWYPCYSQDGMDNFIRGTEIGRPTGEYNDNVATDYCLDSTMLREYYLNRSCHILFDDEACSYGCDREKGVCSDTNPVENCPMGEEINANVPCYCGNNYFGGVVEEQNKYCCTNGLVCDYGCDSTGACVEKTCGDCGEGLFNLCDEDECKSLGVLCKYSSSLLSRDCEKMQLGCDETDDGKDIFHSSYIYGYYLADDNGFMVEDENEATQLVQWVGGGNNQGEVCLDRDRDTNNYEIVETYCENGLVKKATMECPDGYDYTCENGQCVARTG